MSRPYLVGAPAFDRLSGGCIVIHRFAHELNLRGQEAYVTTKTTNPDFNAPSHSIITGNGMNARLYQEWREEKNPISVYPEITWGNPHDSKTVVRYLLNNAGKLRGPADFDSTDILFAFSHMFNDFNLPEERLMFLPAIDTDIYKDVGAERDKVVYYIGKGTRNAFIEETENAIEVIRETTTDPQFLAGILQTSKILYCYDNITAFTELARLCGCPVVLVPSGEYTEDQYSKHELGLDGLGWGRVPEPFDSLAFHQKYLDLRETFYQKLDYFIELTQNS